MGDEDILSRTYDILPEVDENSPADLPPINIQNRATICELASPYAPNGYAQPALAVNSEARQSSALLIPRASPSFSSSVGEMGSWSTTHGRFWLSRTITQRTNPSSTYQRHPLPRPPIGGLDPQAPSTPVVSEKCKNRSPPPPGSSGGRRRSLRLLAKNSPAVTSSTLPPADSERQLWSASHGTFWLSRTKLHRTAQPASSQRQQAVPPPSIGRLDLETPSTPVSGKKDNANTVQSPPQQSTELRRSPRITGVSPARPPLKTPSANENGTWSKTHGTFWLTRSAASRSALRSGNRGQLACPRPPLRPLNGPDLPTTNTPMPGKVRCLEASDAQSADCVAAIGLKSESRQPNHSSPSPLPTPLSSATVQTPVRRLWINGSLRVPSTVDVLPPPPHTAAAAFSTKPESFCTPAPIKSVLRTSKPATNAPTERVERTVKFDTQLRTPLSGVCRIPRARNLQSLSAGPRS